MARLLSLLAALLALSAGVHAQGCGVWDVTVRQLGAADPQGAAVFTDLGFPLAGNFGLLPTLEGSGDPSPGQLVTLQASKMAKSSHCWLLVGREPAFTPFKGGTLVPDIFLGFGPVPTRKGLLFWDVIWPHHIPAGTTFYAQVWILDNQAVQGLSASNGLAVLSQ